MSNTDNIFGKVISTYSIDQAIEDGILVHFSAISPGKWCVTNAVWGAIQEKTTNGRTPVQALSNLMSDAISFIKQNAAKVEEQAREGMPLFCDDFARYMAGNVTGEKLWIGGNETGGFTVMFPSDY